MRTVNFSGYVWNVRKTTEPSGPGPNLFSDSVDNVFLDSQRNLHLRILNVEGIWHCAQVESSPMGHGTYYFQTKSNILALDHNVALGICAYNDDSHETDFEYSKYGNPAATDIGGFTTQPAPYTPENHLAYSIDQVPSPYTISQWFVWSPDKIEFMAAKGEYMPTDEVPSVDIIKSWTCNLPRDALNARAIMNLWLFQGHPLTCINCKKLQEVVITRFFFKPLSVA